MIAGVRYARIFWIGAAGTVVLAALIGISALVRSDLTETEAPHSSYSTGASTPGPSW